jgi:hypothetical protein
MPAGDRIMPEASVEVSSMSEPEFLVCTNCETACYTFEWSDGQVTEALCTACGADEIDEFMTQEDFEALEAG